MTSISSALLASSHGTNAHALVRRDAMLDSSQEHPPSRRHARCLSASMLGNHEYKRELSGAAQEWRARQAARVRHAAAPQS
jgi:hypothetical protein